MPGKKGFGVTKLPRGARTSLLGRASRLDLSTPTHQAPNTVGIATGRSPSAPWSAPRLLRQNENENVLTREFSRMAMATADRDGRLKHQHASEHIDLANLLVIVGD